MSKPNARLELSKYFKELTEHYLAYALKPIGVPNCIMAIDPGISNMAVSIQFFEEFQFKRHETVKIKAADLPTVALQVEFLREVLTYLIQLHGPELIVKEDVARGMVMRAADMGRVAQMIDAMAIEQTIPVITINPATLRSYLGSKSKSDTKLAVYKRWGLEFKSEDEADAFAIGQAGMARVTGQLKLGSEKRAEKRAAKRDAA